MERDRVAFAAYLLRLRALLPTAGGAEENGGGSAADGRDSAPTDEGGRGVCVPSVPPASVQSMELTALTGFASLVVPPTQPVVVGVAVQRRPLLETHEECVRRLATRRRGGGLGLGRAGTKGASLC